MDNEQIVIEPDGATTIKIEGYLTELKLSNALQQLTADHWLGNQVAVGDTRQRWDMAYQIGGTVITVVEYDSDEHYRHSIKMKADRAKDEIARSQGHRLVRLPYWVQLDDLTLKHYFGLEAKIERSFPHGFFTTKLFPASFCELGIERFRSELLALPQNVREAVISSLRQRASEYGLQYVLPKALVDLI